MPGEEKRPTPDLSLVSPQVVVVSVTWNSEAVLPRWLLSVKKAAASRAVPADVLVVDNASQDNSRALCCEAGVEVLNTGTNLGYAGAINVALDATPQGAHILILNPDTTLHEGCIDALLAELAHPGVGIVVPRIVDPAGNTQPSLRRSPSPLRAWGEAILGGRRAARFPALTEVLPVGAHYDQPSDVDWATGAAMLVSAEARRQLGHWDPTFFLYSEETEYMLRARDRGIRVRYQPAAVVEHLGGDMETSARLWQRAVANRIGLYRRGHGLAASLAYQGGVVVNEALRAISSDVHRAGLASALRPSRAPVGARQGVVAFAGVDWWYHNRAHSDVQLLRQIARERPVLMVNSIGLRVPVPGRSTQSGRRIARKLKSLVRFVRTPDPQSPNFHVMTPLALPLYGNPRIRQLSAALTRWQVTKVARWYMMSAPHLFVTIPSADQVVAGMPRTSLTFNRSDLQSSFPEADNHRIERMEEELLRTADLVLYVSRELMLRDSRLVGDRAHYLDHGADPVHFTATPHIPDDIAGIPSPRIGFFGGLDDYVVDFDLLEYISRNAPDMSLVLIGDATCTMERFDALPNVHWLGMRTYSEIPAYGSAFDVAIMPWLDNEWIRYCNPIKLKEYLALGLPVVSTDFPELEGYRDLIRVGHDHAEFLEQVRSAAAEETSTELQALRRTRVVRETWENKAQELLGLLDATARRDPTGDRIRADLLDSDA